MNTVRRYLTEGGIVRVLCWCSSQSPTESLAKCANSKAQALMHL